MTSRDSIIVQCATYHVEYLRERDADIDDDLAGGVVDGADLLVIVLHQVVQETGLVLHSRPRPTRARVVAVVTRVYKEIWDKND